MTYIVLPGTVFLSARRVLSEGLKGRGYPLAGTLGELLSLAWVALALAVFVPLWGIYGAAAALCQLLPREPGAPRGARRVATASWSRPAARCSRSLAT